jgi:hypothetical protein
MKVLSIRQPWADLIVNGHKDIENRSWPTKVRGPVLIHAGKQFESDSFDNLCINPVTRRFMRAGRFSYDVGGIVGIAEIVDCVTASKSIWFNGEYGFVLRNARPLPFSPMRGMLGFFDAPDDYRAAMSPEQQGQKGGAM